MTIELTKEEIEYFNQEKAWLGAPDLEITFYFREELDSLTVYRHINSLIEEVHWKGEVKQQSLIGHIAKIDSSTVVGTYHWFSEQEDSFYLLTIPGNEQVRLFGVNPQYQKLPDNTNLEGVEKLLNFLIAICRNMSKELPLFNVQIVDEQAGAHRQAHEREAGILIDPQFAPCIKGETWEIEKAGWYLKLPFSQCH